ncbi:MAG: hypothetical protein ACSHW4_04580 [Cellulophaga sp.]
MANIKQLLVQTIAISISLLYVLHPLQHQIKDGLHAISHAIEAQNTVATHSHSHTSTKAHSHSHAIHHEHQIITFFNDLFGAPENDSNDSLVQEIKIDKHIADTYAYNIKNNTTLTINYIYTSTNKTAKGYIAIVEKPPKSALA